MVLDRADDSVTVTGEAVVPAVPDETHHITVLAVRDRAEDALQDVTTRSHRLDALLDELEIPPARRSTTALSVAEKREWVQERSEHRGFEAKLSADVAIGDPSIAGRLLHRSGGRAGASVEGPRWRVDRENPVRLEVRREAAQDAERKAHAYAEALGVRLGAVRSIVESTAWARSGGHMLAGARAEMAADEIGINANLELAASVTVSYGIDR